MARLNWPFCFCCDDNAQPDGTRVSQEGGHFLSHVLSTPGHFLSTPTRNLMDGSLCVVA